MGTVTSPGHDFRCQSGTFPFPARACGSKSGHLPFSPTISAPNPYVPSPDHMCGSESVPLPLPAKITHRDWSADDGRPPKQKLPHSWEGQSDKTVENCRTSLLRVLERHGHETMEAAVLARASTTASSFICKSDRQLFLVMTSSIGQQRSRTSGRTLSVACCASMNCLDFPHTTA
jgi:hypothetical protein